MTIDAPDADLLAEMKQTDSDGLKRVQEKIMISIATFEE
jgi:hypothetical protein